MLITFNKFYLTLINTCLYKTRNEKVKSELLIFIETYAHRKRAKKRRFKKVVIKKWISAKNVNKLVFPLKLSK